LKIERRGPREFAVEFESEAELRAEERSNLAVGGLLLRPADPLPPFTVVTVTLALAGRGATTVQASVVAAPPGAIALRVQGDAANIVPALLAAAAPPAASDVANGEETRDETAETDEIDAADTGTLWDRLRQLTPPQKMLLAPKADRATRALLVQDSDPMVLFALLKNPRLSLDEVVRIAKSSFLSFQAAELILKTSQFVANLDVRVALIHNPKLALPLALRLLPTLPDPEVRAIAKGAATSNALKQAALRRVVGG